MNMFTSFKIFFDSMHHHVNCRDYFENQYKSGFFLSVLKVGQKIMYSIFTNSEFKHNITPGFFVNRYVLRVPQITSSSLGIKEGRNYMKGLRKV